VPNRLIRDSICLSDSVDHLSYFEEVFFYRLIVNCDDYGRFDARPNVLKGRLFPLKTVTEKQLVDALNKLSTEGIVILYEYDSRPYLQFVTWNIYQQIRAKKSKYPEPDPNSDNFCKQLISSASNGYHLLATDIICTRNPIQSNPIRNPVVVVDARENVDDDNVFKFYQDNISPLPNSIEYQTITAWLDQDKLEPLFIMDCIKAASEQNVKTLAYVKAIVNKCIEKGIRTAEGFRRDQELFEAQKTVKNAKQSTRSKPGNVGNFEQREYSEDYFSSMFEDVSKYTTGGNL